MIADRGSIGKVYWTTHRSRSSFRIRMSSRDWGDAGRRVAFFPVSFRARPWRRYVATRRHWSSSTSLRHSVSPSLLKYSCLLFLSLSLIRILTPAVRGLGLWIGLTRSHVYIYIYAITEEVLSFIDPNCILNNINFYTNILILTIDVQN